MKNAYRLFVGLLVVTMSVWAYADVVSVPDEGAGSIDAATIVTPMSPDTTVWVQNTFGNEIELYSGTTPSVPSGSQGLMIGGAGYTAQIKVITDCLQNLGQTTVMNNGSLTVSGSDGTVDYLDNNLTISGGSALVKKNYYSLRNGGNITISDGSLEFQGRFRVGYDSAGAVDQTGGTVTLNTISSGDNKYMSIGYKSGANGEYNMSGGTLNTPLELFIGHNSGTEGTLEMTGGTVNSSTGVRIGAGGAGTLNLFGGEFIQSAGWTNIAYDAGSKGSLVVKGGTFTYSSNDLRVGRAGDGSLTLESGYVNLGEKNLVVSSKSGSTGNFTMSGGTLTANGILLGDEAGSDGTATFNGVSQYFAGDVNVGSNGNGSLTLNAASISNDGAFYVANHTGATGEANLNSGSSVSTKGDINVGRSGTGTLTLDSSSIESTDGYLYVGTNAAGDGTVTLKNNSTLSVPKHSIRVGQSGPGVLNIESGSSYSGAEIYLGYNDGAEGTLNINNGSTTSKGIIVGNIGTGTLNATNASMTITSGGFFIGGNESDSKPAGTGTATLTNTPLTVPGDIGVGNYGTGTLILDGSTTLSTNGYLYVARHTGSTGTLTLQNGARVTVPDHTARLGQSGTAVVNVLSGSTFDSSTKDIHLGYNDVGNGTLNVDGGTVNSLKIWVGNNGTGTLSVKNGAVDTNKNNIYVGNNSGSTGTLNLMDGGLINTGTSHVYVGTAAGSTGTFNMTGGILTAGDLRIGDTGTGVANISGGTIDLAYVMYAGIYNGADGTINVSGANTKITAAGNIIAGYEAGATGSITIDGATVNGNSELRVGRYGDGTMTLKNDAKVTVAGIVNVGQYAGATGELNVEGGTFTGNGELRIADLGKGTMNITGGSASAAGLVNVGYGAGSEGKVTISNGTLTLPNSGNTFRIGRYGTGEVDVLEGGQLIVEKNTTQLGYYNTGYGTLKIDGGYAKLKKLDIGYAADSVGYFEMTDGTLDILAVTDGNEINVGYSGYGYAKISGGEVNLVSLRVGRENGSYGQLTIEGDGVMNLSSAARISFNAGSDGKVFIKDNGQLNVTKELTIGNSDKGSVEVSGGQLNANPIVIKDNGSTLKVTGGMVTSPSITIPQADSLDWTGGGMDIKTVTGDLNQKGGILYPGVSTIVAAEILGNYTQASNGTVVIDVDQANNIWDTITVSNGDLDLNGTLFVNFTDDQGPIDDFQIFNVNNGTMDLSGLTLAFPEWYSYADAWMLSPTGLLMAVPDPNATPEPSTWALLILGAAGMLYWRKRNSK